MVPPAHRPVGGGRYDDSRVSVENLARQFFLQKQRLRAHLLHPSILQTTAPLIPQVFFLPENSFTPITVVCLFAAMWAFAIALKSRPLMLAAAIVMLAPLPINFIPYRGFFVMYLPLVGWALYSGTTLILIKDRLATAWMPARAGAFIVTALVLFTIQFRDRVWTLDSVDPNMMLIRDLRADLLNIRPRFRPPRESYS